jgi:exopolysaccharide biosynthesis polyprenyl glycosylphosphotransferase
VGLDLFARLRSDPQLEYDALGMLGEASATLDPSAHLGGVGDLAETVRRLQVRDVFVALPSSANREILEIVKGCERLRVICTVVPDVYSIIMTVPRLQDVAGGVPAIRLERLPIHTPWGRALKRAFDIEGALLGLLLSLPVGLWVAWRMRREGPGPVFYSQERVGLDGRVFWCHKFRSMKVDAEKETGPVWAARDDPRRTEFGAFLRKYSLDEIPQFWNVLTGEMSLVGPRPERPHFVEQFSSDVPYYMERHRVKAGLTGWAQINGLRGQAPIEVRTEYDIWYIENWSIWLDLEIVLRTLGVVIWAPTGN